MTLARCMVSAGEPSGDLHAGSFVHALRRRVPDVEVDALGGPHLAAAGARIIHSNDRLAAMGLIEAVGSTAAHMTAYRHVRGQLRRGAYDLVVLVDYPGFHLQVAAAARRAGVPVLYYIAPQLWAWGAWRLPRLAAVVDRLAVVLPFEESFFHDAGVPAQYVGHPLVTGRAETTGTESLRERVGLSSDDAVLGLLPGSRAADVRRHWPAFRDAARCLMREIPHLRVLVATVDGARYPEIGGMTAVPGGAAGVVAAADAVIAKSGTATLEAALADTPHVIAYRMHAVTHRIARRVVSVPWIGLASLIAGRQVAPELVQREATPQNLADAARPLLDPASAPARRQREAFVVVRRRLGPAGAADRTARLALEVAA